MNSADREVLWMLLIGAVVAATVLSVAVILSGCAATEKLETSVRKAATFATLVEPVLVATYEAEQRACLEGPKPAECVTEARKRWTPILESYSAARGAWCALDELATGDARCGK